MDWKEMEGKQSRSFSMTIHSDNSGSQCIECKVTFPYMIVKDDKGQKHRTRIATWYDVCADPDEDIHICSNCGDMYRCLERKSW